MTKTIILPALLLAAATLISGCGKDAPEPAKEGFGSGLGKSYNDMLDQARQGADDVERHNQETEQRIRDAQ